MDKWEYNAFNISWGSIPNEKYLDWNRKAIGKETLVGLDAILNHEGQNGWELVSVVPVAWETTGVGVGRSNQTFATAVFKRRVPSEE